MLKHKKQQERENKSHWLVTARSGLCSELNSAN